MDIKIVGDKVIITDGDKVIEVELKLLQSLICDIVKKKSG